jgi:hypothetical protein
MGSRSRLDEMRLDALLTKRCTADESGDGTSGDRKSLLAKRRALEGVC